MSTALLIAGIAVLALGVILHVVMTILLPRQLDGATDDALRAYLREKKITPSGLRSLVRAVAETQTLKIAFPYFLCILGLVLLVISRCV